ncbi:hypothetical protein A3767_17235, partial [Oleiphilus sp. HI0133]
AIIRFSLILLLSFSVSSCSTFSFFFERLPWLSSWQMSRMFDLTDEQEVQVEHVAEQMKIWFEEEGFPHLLVDLQAAKQEWSESASSEQISDLFDTLEFHNAKFLNELAPRLAPVAVELGEDNLSAFGAYIDDKSEDWFESLESEEDKEDSRIERLENWFGDLNDVQVAMVRRNVQLLKNERDVRVENTRHWVGEFNSSILKQQVSVIEPWIRDPSIWWTEEYASSRQTNRQQLESALIELVPSLTERQKERAADELQDWIDELREVLEGG